MMKTRKIKDKGFQFSWENQWPQFRGKDNWNVWTPVKVEVDHDKVMGKLEVDVYLLFVGITLRWEWMTAKKREIAETIKGYENDTIKTKVVGIVGGKQVVMPEDMELPEGLGIDKIMSALGDAIKDIEGNKVK